MPKPRKRRPGRPSKSGSQIASLKPLGIFRLSDAKKVGVPKQSLARLVDSGEVIHLEHDLYRHAKARINPETEDFAVACARFGSNAAIGGLSALFYYQLSNQAPKQIWVVVPQQKLSRIPRYRCLRTKTRLDMGVDEHGIFRIVSLERAIVEAFRYATKIGLETAVRAARMAIKNRQTTATKILTQARVLKLENFVIKHWEAITIE